MARVELRIIPTSRPLSECGAVHRRAPYGVSPHTAANETDVAVLDRMRGFVRRNGGRKRGLHPEKHWQQVAGEARLMELRNDQVDTEQHQQSGDA